MTLTRRVTLVGLGLSLAVLIWNLITPGNPDHVTNVFIGSILTTGMLLCLWVIPDLAVRVIHSLALGGSAFLYASMPDGFASSAALTILLFVLIHAYGAFRTHALWKLPASVASIFLLCSISSAQFTTPGPEAMGRAAMWTLFVVGFLFILWLALQEFRRQFLDDFAADLIKQNRQLLELNKELVKGCSDGDRT